MAQRALKPAEFANLVNAVTSAFGDPTRRDIYLLLHEHPDGLTASEVGEHAGVHANVARHHLEKLSSGGYLDVSKRASSGAGRPAKVFTAAEPSLHLEFEVGHDDILITLLGKALSRLDPDDAAAMAEEVGVEFGRKMADDVGLDETETHRSFRSALHVVADALSAHGFAARAERQPDSGGDPQLHIVAGHCPFGDVAIEHPVICAVDRGMVKGLLGSLYGETEVALMSSVAQGDDACVTDVVDAAATQ
ncbi:MAG: helix-turn-helix domain-containing protein [Acidimicrobiales bacterium]|nr:helix-turn-helix domain-containing protein [Acidimicrobiales bacterium]